MSFSPISHKEKQAKTHLLIKDQIVFLHLVKFSFKWLKFMER